MLTPQTPAPLEQLDALKREQATAEKNLLERLTQDALKQVDIGVCAMPQD